MLAAVAANVDESHEFVFSGGEGLVAGESSHRCAATLPHLARSRPRLCSPRGSHARGSGLCGVLLG